MTNSREQNSTASDEVLAEHVLENRNHWDRVAPQWVDAAERSWAATSPSWGIWEIDESELNLLPSSMTDMQAIELGCGTAYVSAWMARRGATVTGIDNSQRQLDTARRLMAEYEQPLTLLHGNAEAIPLKDNSFDFAISEYGAAIWCDPYVWIPEAHRLLRQNGQLVFIANHPLATICTPDSGEHCDEQLHQSYFELYRQDWRNADVALAIRTDMATSSALVSMPGVSVPDFETTMKSDEITINFVVTGRVQGVGFRWSTRAKARQLGITGWVRNCVDGRVEGEASGTRSAVAALLEWLRAGPPGARVDSVDSVEN